MGKGNRHRGGSGHSGRKDNDRGSDKEFTQRSFGGSGQKFRGTIGGALGQAERHSEECFAGIKGVRNVRSRIDAQEKILNSNTDFTAYMKAKREMLEFEKKLNAVPAFVEYQRVRKDLRSVVAVLNAAKLKCAKCSFVDVTNKPQAPAAPVEAVPVAMPPAAQQPVASPPTTPQPVVPQVTTGQPVAQTQTA